MGSGEHSTSNGFRLLNNTSNQEFKIYNNINSQLFHDAFETIKPYIEHNECVDLHEDYSNIKCFLSEDGLQGFAIEDNGNLISVFNADTSKKEFVKTIKDFVKEQGANHLDCYGRLADYYNKVLGFKTASLMDYNLDYDHHNIAKNYNMPQVAFMVNTNAEVATKSFNKNQYDEAKAYQLSFINNEVKETSKAKDKTIIGDKVFTLDKCVKVVLIYAKKIILNLC